MRETKRGTIEDPATDAPTMWQLIIYPVDSEREEDWTTIFESTTRTGAIDLFAENLRRTNSRTLFRVKIEKRFR